MRPLQSLLFAECQSVDPKASGPGDAGESTPCKVCRYFPRPLLPSGQFTTKAQYVLLTAGEQYEDQIQILNMDLGEKNACMNSTANVNPDVLNELFGSYMGLFARVSSRTNGKESSSITIYASCIASLHYKLSIGSWEWQL